MENLQIEKSATKVEWLLKGGSDALEKLGVKIEQLDKQATEQRLEKEVGTDEAALETEVVVEQKDTVTEAKTDERFVSVVELKEFVNGLTDDIITPLVKSIADRDAAIAELTSKVHDLAEKVEVKQKQIEVAVVEEKQLSEDVPVAALAAQMRMRLYDNLNNVIFENGGGDDVNGTPLRKDSALLKAKPAVRVDEEIKQHALSGLVEGN